MTNKDYPIVLHQFHLSNFDGQLSHHTYPATEIGDYVIYQYVSDEELVDEDIHKRYLDEVMSATDGYYLFTLEPIEQDIKDLFEEAVRLHRGKAYRTYFSIHKIVCEQLQVLEEFHL